MGNLQPLTLPDTLDPLVVDCPARLAQELGDLAIAIAAVLPGITGRGFSVCVKAIVAGPMKPEPQPITLLVIIEHGRLADRHRATSQDGCAASTYEKVEAAP